MPTRTINLKMVLGKKNDRAELRQALWTTHREVNHAVAKIEKMLLLCRGCEYRTIGPDGEEVVVNRIDVEKQAIQMAREAQDLNHKGGAGRNEDVLKALLQFYEMVVPSCRLDKKGDPEKGNAQASNVWVSPLMDRESRGGMSVYDKVLDPPPHWIEMMTTSVGDWENHSLVWLETDQAKKLQSMKGSPSAWIRRLRSKKPWQEAFVKDQEKKREELEKGNAPLVKSMKELGLLPLINPSIRERLDPEGQGVTPWDRLAMRFAVAHLISWESWNHNTIKEHDQAKQKYYQLCEKYESHGEQFQKLREYEQERHRELKQVAFADDDRPLKIGVRAIRAWDRVREEWIKGGFNYEARKDVLKRLQKKLRSKFGDPHLFLWLADNGRENLWMEADILTPLVKLNVAKRILEKRKPYSLMTFAHARIHPRWAMFEAHGGSNLRNYKIEKLGSNLSVRMQLLQETGNGGLSEKEFSIRLGPSDQLSSLELLGDGKETQLRFRSAHQDFEGVPGGAEILFDRHYMEHPERTDDSIAKGTLGPVWMKFTLDVKSQAPSEWLDDNGRIATPVEVYHFNTALSNKSKHSDKLKPGLRVLSVDLGIRSFAPCSVFELVKGKPDDGLCFPTEDGRATDDPEKLWARHERSFKICLPGERPSKKEKISRKTAMNEIRSIKRDIWRLKDVLRLGIIKQDQEIGRSINDIIESFVEDQPSTSVFNRDILNEVNDPKFRSTPDLWQQHCQEIHDRAEKLVSRRFSEWRSRTRPKSASWEDWSKRRSYHGGKSIWMIEYLESVRSLIMSWNFRGRKYGQVNRQDKKQFGTIASGLLKHINKLKKDRVKSGSDLIIQAARGYVPLREGIGWDKKHNPCRVILFEDLARYRFRVDRPRRENSQLMKWNHREILSETKMQAELYGIVVETTAAGYSSRYLASNGAPGCLCRYLSEDDFQGGLPKVYVVSELDWMLGNSKHKDLAENRVALKNKIRPGLLVPWSGGELFASVRSNSGSAHIIHSDINSAQILQRRFWGRCSEAYRLACKGVSIDGIDGYTTENTPGVRLLGALQQMAKGAGPFFLKDESGNQRYVMVQSGSKKTRIRAEDDDPSSDDEFDDALSDLGDESGGGRETFFRDPSGIFFNNQHWIPSRQYWSTVKSRVWAAMRK